VTHELLDEIRSGIGGTSVLPGVIGEIGTGQPVTDDEWKVLEAACNAQRETGLPLFIHVYPMLDGTTAPEITQFVLDHGVLPSRVNICHMDGHMEIPYLRTVLDMGVYISFDTFGIEAYYDSIDRRSRFDAEREAALLTLLELGYAPQLLLSQDVCMKMQLRRYGGMGYSHILRHIVPSLCRRGVGADVVDQLLRENAMRILTVEGDSRASGAIASQDLIENSPEVVRS
jgi:phosphotriesterase-related protein